jgi:hypothetical protein
VAQVVDATRQPNEKPDRRLTLKINFYHHHSRHRTQHDSTTGYFTILVS